MVAAPVITDDGFPNGLPSSTGSHPSLVAGDHTVADLMRIAESVGNGV